MLFIFGCFLAAAASLILPMFGSESVQDSLWAVSSLKCCGGFVVLLELVLPALAKGVQYNQLEMDLMACIADTLASRCKSVS